MPTYEYKCQACEHQFEKFQSITADPIKECPACGKKKVKRLIGTGGGIIFKGSGFYITDYRSDGYKSAAKSDGGSTSKPADSSSTSTTSTTAEKPVAATPAKSAASTKKAK